MPVNIDDSTENKFVFHRRFLNLVDELKANISKYELFNHFFLLSSGTTANHLKGYALSKEALETNALAVNQHLKLNSGDIWGLTLPYYHIGGLAILFRAKLLNHDPINLFPWDPKRIVKEISEKKVNVISLVPTQVYDLVKLELKCPKEIKYVLVGGDYLGDELFLQATNLGWPIIKTFGMTELGSQLATSSINNPRLKILPIHQVKTNEQNQLYVKSKSLFTLMFTKKSDWSLTFSNKMLDSENYFPLADSAKIDGDFLSPLGRLDESFKSSGHLLDLNSIREELQKFLIEKKCWGKIEVFSEVDPRKGRVLSLIYEGDLPRHYLEELELRIYPIRVDKKNSVTKIDRTELGKFKLPI